MLLMFYVKMFTEIAIGADAVIPKITLIHFFTLFEFKRFIIKSGWCKFLKFKLLS